jgi:hypothetical protein
MVENTTQYTPTTQSQTMTYLNCWISDSNSQDLSKRTIYTSLHAFMNRDQVALRQLRLSSEKLTALTKAKSQITDQEKVRMSEDITNRVNDLPGALLDLHYILSSDKS